jgi:hypothetical protein
MATDSEDGAPRPGVGIHGGTVETGGGDIVGRDKYIIVQPTRDAQASFRHRPRLLPYLTNRREQQRLLALVLQSQLDNEAKEPVIFFAVGNEDECIDSFVEQLRYVRLPEILESNGLSRDPLFRTLQWPGADSNDALSEEEIARQFEDVENQIREALGVKVTASKTLIQRKLADTHVCCCFHIGLSLSEWGTIQTEFVRRWVRWWSELDLSGARYPIVTLISVVYPPGFLQRWLRWHRALALMLRNIAAISSDKELSTAIHLLPELGSVRFADVEQWIRDYVEDADREVLRRRLRRHPKLSGLDRGGFPCFEPLSWSGPQ